MPKLSDTQLVILSAAARRQDGSVLPLPRSLKVNKAAATTVLKGLLKKGLAAERSAAADEAHWRETRDGGRTALAITDAGLQAIGVDADEKTGKQSLSTKTKPRQRNRRAERKPSGAKPKGGTSPPAVRPGTKQALLINLLKRKKGATIEAAVAGQSAKLGPRQLADRARQLHAAVRDITVIAEAAMIVVNSGFDQHRNRPRRRR